MTHTLTFPHSWKLNRQDKIVLSMLLESNERTVTTDAIYDRLYETVPDGRSANNVSQRIHQLRKRVPRIVITRHYGLGYSIPCAIRKRLLDECIATERERLKELDALTLLETTKYMQRMQQEISWCQAVLRRLGRDQTEMR